MSQIVQMFEYSNDRMQRLMDSLRKGSMKPDMEIITGLQREFEGQIKLINAVVSAFGVASKNKRALTGLERMNIMDDTTAVDLGLPAPEEDKVKCPIMEKLITRQECLDRSGSQEHYEECRGCEVGLSSRKKCELVSADEAFRYGIDQ